MTSRRRFVQVLIEAIAVLTNAGLWISLSVMKGSFFYTRIAQTNLATLAEWTLSVGLVAGLVVVLLRWHIKTSVSRLGLLLSVTLCNQMCLLALLIAKLPFGGIMLKPPH